MRIGARVLYRVRPDPRLAAVVAVLEEALRVLEDKNAVHIRSIEEAGSTAGVREGARQMLEDALREFGLLILSSTRNNFHTEPYLSYYPDGYGKAIHLSPAKLCQFAEVIGGKLAEEGDPKLVAYRESIATARAALLAAEAAHAAALEARQNAFEYLESAKRDFVEGLSRARLLAESICVHERRYIKNLFAPATRPRLRRRTGDPEESEEPDGEVVTPEPEVPEASQVSGEAGS